MLDQLRQFTSDTISDSTHHELFTRLYHVMLDYRMKENVFSRVRSVHLLTSMANVFNIVCRGCFRHLKIMFWKNIVIAMGFARYFFTWLPSQSW